jgi:invasion protein IalB
VSVAVALGTAVSLAVGVAVEVGMGMLVAVEVAVCTAVGEVARVAVDVAVAVGVARGGSESSPHAASASTANRRFLVEMRRTIDASSPRHAIQARTEFV